MYNCQAMAGASNPAIGGNQNKGDGPAQEVAGTLPQDFTLKGMKVGIMPLPGSGHVADHASAPSCSPLVTHLFYVIPSHRPSTREKTSKESSRYVLKGLTLDNHLVLMLSC